MWLWVRKLSGGCRTPLVWHGLMSEDERNVSGWTRRIPQSCATRALRWQEPATYFSMRTRALRLVALSVSSARLAPCLFFCPSFSSSLASSPRRSLAPSSIRFPPFYHLFSLPAHCLCVSSLRMSAGLSVTPSILLSYFASCLSDCWFRLLFSLINSLFVLFSFNYLCL